MKLFCKLRSLECDTASVRQKQGGFLSFLSGSLEHTFFLVCFLYRICQTFQLVPDFFLTFEDLIIHVLQLFCLLSKNAHNTPKILHELGLQFVCNDCNTREKLGKMVTKNKAERKQSVLWATQKLRINPVDTCNIGGYVNVSLLLIRQVVTITPQRFERFLSWVRV